MKKNRLKQRKSTTSQGRERLLMAAKSKPTTLLENYNNTLEGYEVNQVVERLDQYGSNELSHQDETSVFKRLIEAFVNPFTIVLFVLGIISFIMDVILAKPEDKSYVSVMIVVTMVSISGLLRFVQETRSGNAAEKLKAMIETTISVQRKAEGVFELPISDLVVGDIIYLAAGDMIPADVRILTSKDLFISQSSLTGESEPLEKFSEALTFDHENLLDLNNLGFMGSNVVSGSATCMVIATGDETLFGNVAKTITKEKVKTSFEKGVNSVSWVLIRFMMVMVPFVLLINGFTKGDWLQAFLFALSVGVGLTPEMLPMIVTTNLAKGAVKLAQQKTVVKNMNSIQNLGAMDVLCTDKTGTLTKDKVELEHYLDIHGNSDMRVLRHAFLNSYYQTGLKNLMDVAILNHAQDNLIKDLKVKYTKVDEIPFDFNRRRMSVVIQDESGKTQLITKGAVEEMLMISGFAEYNGKVEVLTDAIKKDILEMVKYLNDEGMRVIAVAQKTNPESVGLFSVENESDMVLMGYLAFLDPPKETTASALKALGNYGISVKILTGDNDGVTKNIANQVGLNVERILVGTEVETMDQKELLKVVETTTLFAKLSPQQKTRIVSALRDNGHVVGFMGDGINDAAAMRASDVGISVDTAVDIAKESADIILLEKDLMVLERGVIEGRRTFANMIKYIKMTASSNFGNMFSVLVASALLPFLPMMPLQILVLNLIYDISCIAIPWDNVDRAYLRKPRRWEAKTIGDFMRWMGPTSSVFDIMTYGILFFVICPSLLGGNYASLDPAQQLIFVALFQTGWFVESLWSQTMVVHMIRSPKIPFLQSRAAVPVIGMTTLGILVGTILPYTQFGTYLGMKALPLTYYFWLVGIIIGYMLLVTTVKRCYIRRKGTWL